MLNIKLRDKKFRVFTMAKEFKKPLFVWRSHVAAGTVKYQLIRTVDGYRTRISKADFCKAYNTLEITGIHPAHDPKSEFVLFDFYTETLTDEMTAHIKNLKKVRVSRGKLSTNQIVI